jgi:hypothetical protein
MFWRRKKKKHEEHESECRKGSESENREFRVQEKHTGFDRSKLSKKS